MNSVRITQEGFGWPVDLMAWVLPVLKISKMVYRISLTDIVPVCTHITIVFCGPQGRTLAHLI